MLFMNIKRYSILDHLFEGPIISFHLILDWTTSISACKGSIRSIVIWCLSDGDSRSLGSCKNVTMPNAVFFSLLYDRGECVKL